MKFVSIIGAAAIGLLTIAEASALPVLPAPTAGAEPAIVLARAGCGFGEHRGPYGGCRLNRGPRGAMRRMVTGAPRGCPPGLRRGPAGRCHR